MAFTFDPGLTTALSRVRQTIGDTVDAGHLVEDATITYYLSTRSELASALQLSQDLMARFAGEVDKDFDGQGVKASQRYKQYKDLAATLERKLAQEGGSSVDGEIEDFSGIGAFGTTAQEVIDARADTSLATNAPLRWL